MPAITASARDLFTLRLGEVNELVQPLRPASRIQCQFYRYQHGGGKVLAAHDAERPDTDFQAWRCRTFVNEIWCQYYELWKPFNNERHWFLDRAYFHLYKANREERKLDQFLCIHSDPNCADPAPLNRFKSGPHLHILNSDAPIPDCHFPLNLGHLEAVLATRLSLTDAFRSAIEVICGDVLYRFQTQ
jgi:hypothetical protein